MSMNKPQEEAWEARARKMLQEMYQASPHNQQRIEDACIDLYFKSERADMREEVLKEAIEAVETKRLNEDLCDPEWNHGLDGAIAAIRSLSRKV